MGQGLADRVVPGVGHHRVHVVEERHLGDEVPADDVGRQVGAPVRRGHQDALGRQGGEGLAGGGEEPPAPLEVHRAQAHQDLGAVGEGVPGEVDLGAVGEGRAHEGVVPGPGPRAHQGLGGEHDHQVGREVRGAGGRVEARLGLEGAHLLVEPGLDLGQARQGVGDGGGGGDEAGPGQAPAPGDQGARQRLVVDDQRVGGEGVHHGLDPRPHGPGQRHQEVLPEELQGRQAADRVGPRGHLLHERPRAPGRRARRGSRPRGALAAPPPGAPPRPPRGPGPARLAATETVGFTCPVSGGHHEEEAAHAPAPRTQAPRRSFTVSVASQRTEWPQPGSTSTVARGSLWQKASPTARTSESAP